MEKKSLLGCSSIPAMASYNSNLSLIIVLYVVSLSSMVIHCVDVHHLDDLIRTFAGRSNSRRRTGSLYKITLPTNLSGVEASVVTVRNSIFWRKGANFSGFYIPPLVKTTPYSKRIALLFDTLGDSSSRYFRVAGYSFVSPVVGFSAYDATNPNDLGVDKLNLSIMGEDIIIIRFDSYVTHVKKMKNSIKCVAFLDGNNNDGSVEFSNMTRNYECTTNSSYGHFALVVPNNQKPESKVKLEWKWLVLAVTGIVIVMAAVVAAAKLMRKKRMREMERESEKSEATGYIWIGGSRMPTAAMLRTQPSIEHHEDFDSSNSSFRL